ncbi:hypothetical protein KIN20_016317 [Parelaphostrongylus tenuis]|uniref:Uncharacterized protein n=1 Tax=Parelaphostrongylus tenuis TaxID=148309 RepID=A0AAD5QT38_PARTN|nr:hypothetical protein KIN20_016317 [Parelaphostrongylus tenuis]
MVDDSDETACDMASLNDSNRRPFRSIALIESGQNRTELMRILAKLPVGGQSQNEYMEPLSTNLVAGCFVNVVNNRT